MGLVARSLVVLFALGFVGCGKRPVAESSGKGGSAGGGAAAGATGSGGGATPGAGGGGGSAVGGSAVAGSAGNNGSAGSAGNTGSAGNAGNTGSAGNAGNTGSAGNGGSSGGVTGGSGGGAGRGGNAGSAAGGATAGVGGATAGAGGATAGSGGGSGLGPLRLVIFYTRWGTTYPEWWPAGGERDFTMSAMLQPLQAHKNDLILLSGVANADFSPTSAGGPPMIHTVNVSNGDAMRTLLTARPVAGTSAGGPSLDTAIGDCGGAAGLPLRLAVGGFETDDTLRVSYDAAGAPISGERDPHAAALRVLGHDVTAPAPGGDINVDYPAIGAAHIQVLAEALAAGKTCAAVLAWGDQVTPTSLGLNQTVHEMSHTTGGLYEAIQSPGSTARSDLPFFKLQHWYAQQFASLLDRLAATPVGGGTLLDRSVVVWISESGQGYDHLGFYIPVVIAGGGGGRLDVGRFFEVKPHIAQTGQFVDTSTIIRTQGDLLAALASLWGLNNFGAPQIASQPLTEILKP